MGIMNEPKDEQQSPADVSQGNRVVVVSQRGMGVADQPGDGKEAPDASGPSDPSDLVEHPGKVMRIASMIKQLLEEVRSAPLDEAGRTRRPRSTAGRSVSWRRGWLRSW